MPFFWQLLFPIANPAENEIQHDPRLPYYEDVGEFSNLYSVMVKNRGGSRTHGWRTTDAQEQVRHDGITGRNKNPSIVDCWNEDMDDCYDPVIANALSVSRWVDLKLNMKLIDPREEMKMPDRG